MTANFQYSNAGGLGTQNAGLYGAGSLFRWDTASNDLVYLDTLPLAPAGPPGAKADLASENVAGIGLSGLPVGPNRAIIEAGLGAKASFVSKGTERQAYVEATPALRQYVERLIAEGTDADLVLKTRDPATRLVVIGTTIRSETSELTIGGVDVGEKDKILTLKIAGSAELNVRVSASARCERPSGPADGPAPVCFFSPQIFDPEYVPGNPRLQFVPGAKNGDPRLSAAFRKMR